MNHRLTDILYNPSSINSVEQNTPEPERQPQTPQETRALIAAIEKPGLSDKAVYDGLIALKRRLLLPLPLVNRLSLIENFNSLLKKLAARFTNNIDLFHSAIQIITLFKDQVEARPQNESATLRSEWVELEKTIYHLTSWEGQLDYFWSEAN